MALALDIGGTKLAAAVVGADGSCHGHVVTPTLKQQGCDAVLSRLVELGRRAIGETGGVGAATVVGVSCGGPLDPESGTVHSPPNLPGWDDVPLTAILGGAFGLPAVLVNDASAAALAEARFGAAKDARVALYLTLSTGVGGGLVIGDEVYHGAAGNGGEPGHLCVRPGGRLCPCGRRGCLEAYASGTSIAARAKEALLVTAEASRLRELPDVRCEDVVAAAADGDVLAQAVWSETIDVLAEALTDLVNVFEPDAVILGGGVTRAGHLLLDPLRARVTSAAMPPAARTASIHLAGLADRSCLVGAATVALDRERATAWQHARAPRPQAATQPPPRRDVSRRPDLDLTDRMESPVPKPTPDQFQVVPTTPLLEAELDSHLRTVEAARGLLPETAEVAAVLCAAFATGHLLFSFGNGGSAADAQHLTGELIGHYRADRRPLGAVTLTTDPTVTTCIANDYAWEKVFARQVTGLARPGDVVAAFTTSGRSANVVEGLRAAQDAGATTVLFTGGDGGPARHHADHVLLVPSTSTPRIQEVHTLLLHVISGIVDVWAVEQPAVVAAGGGGAR